MAQGQATIEEQPELTDGLPPVIAARLDGEAEGQTIVGWSEFDLDSENRFTRQYVVLTDQRLIRIGEDGKTAIELSTITQARIVEGLGVDKLAIVAGDSLAMEMRYSRRRRRTMTRLHRKLQRRIESDPTKADLRPE